MRLLIINGPNLNQLGKRDPTIYGNESLDQINHFLLENNPGLDLEFYQSNHEGAIIDFLQEKAPTCQGIVINPGALTHYSYSLRDAINACAVPVIEVHLSNIYKRESFRQTSVTAPESKGIISGFGKYGYQMAIEAFKNNRVG